MQIKSVHAVKVKNSNNQDAIEVIVNGKYKGSSPSGTSTGKYEVNSFSTNGIQYSIDFVNDILNKQLENVELETFDDLEILEEELWEHDSSQNLSKIGGNTVVALEYALLKGMFAKGVFKGLSDKWKIPMPLGNVIGGGRHAKNSCDVQEFLLLPKSKTFAEAVYANKLVHTKVGSILKAKQDQESAWICRASTDQILDLLTEAKEDVEKKLGIKIGLGMDVAANSLYSKRKYNYKIFSRSHKDFSLSINEQAEWINSLIKKYKLVYVEDAFEENDFNSFGKLNDSALICGDDLICTNLERLKNAVGKINAVIIKPNQIGSLVETKKVVDFALKNNITPVMSHRAGETLDTTICHLAVAWNIPIVKFGIKGNYREAKLNEIIRIERAINI